MTDFDKIKEYLTDKYNEFNDVEDTKSMEIIADVFYFVEHVEAQSLVMGDDINSQIQEKFMNLVTEHVAQKALDKENWPTYTSQVFTFRPMTQLMQKRRYRVVLDLEILDDSHPADFNWDKMLDIGSGESVHVVTVDDEDELWWYWEGSTPLF